MGSARPGTGADRARLAGGLRGGASAVLHLGTLTVGAALKRGLSWMVRGSGPSAVERAAAGRPGAELRLERALGGDAARLRGTPSLRPIAVDARDCHMHRLASCDLADDPAASADRRVQLPGVRAA